jgi:aspartyl-tRNA(Asn)/glutamyl-tRNA(Gln) amidotransferase subunit A
MLLSELTIKKAHAGLKNKEFSAVELAQACLDQAKAKSDLNAYVTLIDEALKQAEAVDVKLAAGKELGVLEGIPAGIKDLLNTRGVRTTCCSPGMKDFVPPYDATVVKRLKDAGMVMIGKTNLDEFACGASTEHSCFGHTKNPWNLECVAGGSSGGSAAAVAADTCLFAIGTDTGGSIRQPASFCSVSGLKVTYGRVSRYGVTAFASSWDTVGPFAKTAEDLAYVLQAMAGQDENDLTTPPKEVPDYAALLSGDVKGLKIGVPKEYFVDGIDSEVKENVMSAVRELEAAGAIIKEISLPMTKYAISMYYIATPAELSANLARFDGVRFGTKAEGAEDLIDYYFKQRTAGFGPEIKRRIMIGTYVLSAGYYDAYYKKAQRVRTKIIQDFDNAFSEVDVICGPVAPTPAFKAGDKVDDPLEMYMADALTIPASAAGLPGLSVPCGFSKQGLPIGLQIIGPQFEEGRVLNVGHAFQQITDWHTKRPHNTLK